MLDVEKLTPENGILNFLRHFSYDLHLTQVSAVRTPCIKPHSLRTSKTNLRNAV